MFRHRLGNRVGQGLHGFLGQGLRALFHGSNWRRNCS
jgi:hypothetical protein